MFCLSNYYYLLLINNNNNKDNISNWDMEGMYGGSRNMLSLSGWHAPGIHLCMQRVHEQEEKASQHSVSWWISFPQQWWCIWCIFSVFYLLPWMQLFNTPSENHSLPKLSFYVSSLKWFDLFLISRSVFTQSSPQVCRVLVQSLSVR